MLTARAVAALVAAMTIGASAAAQTAPPTSATRQPFGGWSAQAGYEAFSLRDISRSGTPPDASPITWRGTGPVITGRYEIARIKSAHLFDISVSRDGDFAYVAPTRSTAANENDFAARLEGRYEYRRYFFRDVGFDGLDIGLGAQAAGTRVAFDRHITPALQTKTRTTGGGVAGVVSMRVRRWQRVGFDASWGNGAIVSHRTTAHSQNPAGGESFSGGNWLSDLMARADVLLTRAAYLSVTWRSAYDGYQSDHMAYANYRHSFNVGIRYGY